MVQIHNSDLTKELQAGAKTQAYDYGKLPNQLAEKVVPVMEVNPKMLRVANFCESARRTLTGSSTLQALTTGRDLYITNINLNTNIDAGATITEIYISFMVGGVAKFIMCPLPSATALSQSMTLNLSVPLKVDIDRQTVAFTITAAAGTFTCSANVIGFWVDNPKS